MLSGRLVSYESNDPYHNLALEQAILNVRSNSPYGLTLLLWKNHKAVVIGRGQSVENEVNIDYCKKKGIAICRRISGGGAVYQDGGNINISIISPWDPTRLPSISVEVTGITDLLMESLGNVGFHELKRDGRYNILYRGRKVSGGAAYFTRESLLHHSTLLLSANLADLEASLKHGASIPGRTNSKHFPTANLPAFPLEKWKTELVKLVETKFNARIESTTPSKEEIMLARELRDAFHSNPRWIFEGKKND